MLPECYERFLSAAAQARLLNADQLVELRPWMVQQATDLRQMLEDRAREEIGGGNGDGDADPANDGWVVPLVGANDTDGSASGKPVSVDSTAGPLSADTRQKMEERFETLCEERLQEWMLCEKWLNRWQVRQLLQGRTRFTLGSYRIVDFIGRGGMGNVFKGVHELIGHEVAIKILPREKMTPRSIDRFMAEVRTISSLSHPRLVRAFDAGFEGKVHYLVTEYVPGRDLRKLIVMEGMLDMATAASIITQVASALDYAHRNGIIHRDVKPANILVTPEGIAKLSDLGLAGVQDLSGSWNSDEHGDMLHIRGTSGPHAHVGGPAVSAGAGAADDSESDSGPGGDPTDMDTWIPPAALSMESDVRAENVQGGDVNGVNGAREVDAPEKTVANVDAISKGDVPLLKADSVGPATQCPRFPRKVVGTRDYLPPDAISDPAHPTPAWDIYSLGCTLYFAVTGQVPFPDPDSMAKLHAHLSIYPVDPRKLNSSLSEPFVERLGQMIRKSPQYRCASARQVMELFSPWLT